MACPCVEAADTGAIDPAQVGDSFMEPVFWVNTLSVGTVGGPTQGYGGEGWDYMFSQAYRLNTPETYDFLSTVTWDETSALGGAREFVVISYNTVTSAQTFLDVNSGPAQVGQTVQSYTGSVVVTDPIWVAFLIKVASTAGNAVVPYVATLSISSDACCSSPLGRPNPGPAANRSYRYE